LAGWLRDGGFGDDHDVGVLTAGEIDEALVVARVGGSARDQKVALGRPVGRQLTDRSRRSRQRKCRLGRGGALRRSWCEESLVLLYTQMDLPFRLSSESAVLQGGDGESGCTMLYCLCGNDNQVLRLEHQVCAVPKGRRGPDRL
jgi:hypothetical protein